MENKDLNINEFLQLLHWERKKFYKNIDNICSEEVYDIDKGQFKKAGTTKDDYKKGENTYCFKKEWVDLAYVLFSMYDKNPYYRSNVDVESVSINDIIDYYNECINLIENKLPPFQRREVQLNPVYSATLEEISHLNIIKDKFQLLFTVASKLPVESRVSFWKEIELSIDQLAIMTYYKKMEYSDKLNNEKGAIFRDQLYGEFVNKSIDNLIAQTLKNYMNKRFQQDRKDIMDFSQHLLEVAGKFAELLDTPETINAVNNEWKQKNGQKIVEEMQDKMFDQEIKEIQGRAKSVVETDIDSAVNALITCYKNFPSGISKEQEKLLKIAGDMVKEDIESNRQYKNTAESILKGISFDINNRRS